MNGVENRPRIALMGEFSAGKSTLANLLLAHDVSPVQVTATQLPPVWYRSGEPSLLRVDKDGSETSVESFAGISPELTDHVIVNSQADLLELCDLIDMPGTSDPNMATDLWQNILPDVDCVLWCTSAAQAWRQSEAALWEIVPPSLWNTSLLLITRMDKLQSDRDRARVLLRVRRETEGRFRDVLPMSLLNEDDSSGLPTLMSRLDDLFERSVKHDVTPVEKRMVSPPHPPASESEVPRVVPRRVVRLGSSSLRPRPERPAP